MKTSRRLILKAGTSLALPVVWPGFAKAEQDFAEESQRGDIEVFPELLRYEPASIKSASSPVKGTFAPVPSNFRDRLLEEASRWVGKNRAADKADISKLMNLFNLPYAQGGRPLPFCAAGISYVAAMVYLRNANSSGSDTLEAIRAFLPELDHAHFYPTPSVNDMTLVAQGKHRWSPAQSVAQPEAGSVVVFSWSGAGVDHVGLVKAFTERKLTTIEFNTSSPTVPGSEKNGGCVTIKTREYPSKYIRGFIRA